MCVSVLGLVIRHLNRIFSAPHYIVICGLSGCTIFVHINSFTTRFSEKYIEYEMCVLIFSTFV